MTTAPLTAAQIEAAPIKVLFPLALTFLKEVGDWEVGDALGYSSNPPPQHWFAELGHSYEDVDILVGGCGTTGREAMFTAALMQDACKMGVLISVGQLRAESAIEMSEAGAWRDLNAEFWGYARYAGKWAEVQDASTMAEAALKAFLLVKFGHGL